jgi:hypothetical protein
MLRNAFGDTHYQRYLGGERFFDAGRGKRGAEEQRRLAK